MNLSGFLIQRRHFLEISQRSGATVGQAIGKRFLNPEPRHAHTAPNEAKNAVARDRRPSCLKVMNCGGNEVARCFTRLMEQK